MNIGDTVSWISQAGGYSKEKIGVIVGFIPPNKSAVPLLNKLDVKVPSSRVKFQSLSELDQVVVEVPCGGKSKITDFYAPRKSQVTYLR